MTATLHEADRLIESGHGHGNKNAHRLMRISLTCSSANARPVTWIPACTHSPSIQRFVFVYPRDKNSEGTNALSYIWKTLKLNNHFARTFRIVDDGNSFIFTMTWRDTLLFHPFNGWWSSLSEAIAAYNEAFESHEIVSWSRSNSDFQCRTLASE